MRRAGSSFTTETQRQREASKVSEEKPQTGRPLRFRELVVSGGGTNNAALMRMIREELAPLKMRVRTTDEFGIPAEAKEAIAFALLAYQTWRRLPSNVPSATGAPRPAVLGKVSYA